MLPVDLDSLYPNLRSVYNAQLTDVIDDDIPVNLTSLKEAVEKKAEQKHSHNHHNFSHQRSSNSFGGGDNPSSLSRQQSINNQEEEEDEMEDGDELMMADVDEDDDECKNEVLQFSSPLFAVVKVSWGRPFWGFASE